MKFLAILYFLLIDFTSDLPRSLLNIASLMAMIVSYMMLSSISQAIRSIGRQPDTFNQLLIISSGVIDPSESILSSEVLQNAKQTVNKAFGEQAILRTAPIIFRHMQINDATYQVIALPPEDFESIYGISLVRGRLPEALDEVVVSSPVASSGKISVGTMLKIYGSEFKVTGIVLTGGRVSSSIVMTYAAGEGLFATRRGFQIGVLQINPNIDLTSVQDYLELVPELGSQYDFYQENQLNEQYRRGIQNLIHVSTLMNGIALLVITFGTFNAVHLSLAERQRDLAILKAVGFLPASIHLFVWLRVLLQTLLACSAGWSVTVLFLRFFNARVTINIHAMPLSPGITLDDTLLAFGLSILFASLGVLIALHQQRRPGFGMFEVSI